MSTVERAAQDLKVIDFNPENFCEQKQSPLFSVFPGEIRDRIFAYTLAEFEVSEKAYDNDTCYRRPEYAAPRRSDTALLRTCQRVYQEAFFYPFALAEQILWLTAADRRPRNVTTVERLKPSLALMHRLHEETELQSVRVFAQSYALEPGHQLNNILNMPHFLPKTMTVTLRHTDIWYWESDNPIHIGGQWTSICKFPNSLRCLNVQVESLERKKDQVDYIVQEMINKWQFKRRDDTILRASDKSVTITSWSGSSTWGGERWLRDETRPETLDYYVATVAFKPIPAEDALTGIPISLQLGPMPNARAIRHPRPNVPEHQLHEAAVPAGATADEVLARFDEHRREKMILAAQAYEAQRQRNERQAAIRSSRRDARRARQQAQVASVYPHQAQGAGQVSADTLRAARATRRAGRSVTANMATEHEHPEGVDRLDPGSEEGESNANQYAALNDTNPNEDNVSEGSSTGPDYDQGQGLSDRIADQFANWNR